MGGGIDDCKRQERCTRETAGEGSFYSTTGLFLRRAKAEVANGGPRAGFGGKTGHLTFQAL